jgi:predicted nucleic acid-binding Zn ribbon protein
MPTAVSDLGALTSRPPCDWCEQHPNRACPACNARRRRAVRLVEDHGLSIAETADRMGLPVERVERLLEEEIDRRAVVQFRRDRVANAPIRQRFLKQRRRDSALTSGEIANRLGTSPIQVERWLGLRATAPKTDRRGRRYPGRVLSTIDVETAGRLARAMGYAPFELDGS